MKKAIIIFCIATVVVIALAQAFGDRDIIGELFPKTGTDASIGHAYEISSDTIFADEASISNLYVGENEKRLRVYDIEVSEDGKSLIIYFVDSDPIIFGGVTNE